MPIIERYRQYEIAKRPDGSLWELGAGAMGITYKAFDTNLHRYVALKVINDTYLGNATAREQFLREARSAAALRHPNVASIHDLGTDHDCHFYVMELIDGTTVKAKVERDGPMAPKVALGIILQVSHALSAAEKQKLIHRDLKPANLMLVEDNDEFAVKIIDFGLAKTAHSLGESTASFTIGDGFVGTAEYASPEQIRENELDVRSDIYSVGATLFYMLAGRPPYTGSPGEVMSKHLYKPVPVERLVGVPPPAVALVQRLMEKERESRPPNAVELRISVEQCLEKLSPSTLANQRTNEDPTAFSIDSSSKSSGKTTAKERYNLLKRLDQTPQGERFLALDEQTGNGVEVFAFNRNALANTDLIAALKTELETLRNAPHPLLRSVFAFEQFQNGTRLIQESFVGLPLLAILRARKELSPVEITLLLTRLAPLADFAQRYDLKQVDLKLTGIWLGSSQGSTPRSEIPLQLWQPLEIKVDPIDLSSSPSASRHSQSEVTAINPIAVGGPRGSYLRQLSLLAYELLGGPRQQVETSGRCPPLSLLNEEANVVLRRGIIDEFGSAAELATGFKRALSSLTGTKQKSYDVFISHAPADQRAADSACAVLERQGIRCWIAPRDLSPGADSGEAIMDAITASEMMLLIYSASAGRSQQVKRELECASTAQLTVIPLRIQNVEPEGAFRFFLGSVRWLDAFAEPLEPHLYETANVICKFLGRSPILPARTTRESRPEVRTNERPDTLKRPAPGRPEAVESVIEQVKPEPRPIAHDSEPAAQSPSAHTHFVPDQYPTIQAAIDVAEPGSIVLVKPGVYEEPLKFKEGIELRGENPETTVVRWAERSGMPADGMRDFSLLAIVDCQSGTVRDLSFAYERADSAENLDEVPRIDAIHILNSAVTVQNCRVTCFPKSGIGVYGARSSPALINNQCRLNQEAGIAFYDGAQGKASQNTCEQNEESGILVNGIGTTPELVENQCRANRRDGMMFKDGSQGISSRNVCEQNLEHGIVVTGSNTAPLLLNNQCRKNQAAGIYFTHGAKGRAESNICESNAWCGIMVIASAPYLSANELLRNLQCGLAYDSKSRLSLGKRNVFSENKQGDLLTKPIIQDR
jgi:parallel beta-helix repeat protein